MDLSKIIEITASEALEKLTDDGSMPAGHNGPYNDTETPVRNTAHWLFTFSTQFARTGESKWKEASFKAIDYLLSEDARPMNASFWCRKNPKKDFCNGVMGQAWVLEALLKAHKVFEREDCYKVAEEVFLLHPWDEENKIWGRVNVDGSYAGPDLTFNHQLWFGAISGYLNNTSEAKYRSNYFLSAHSQNLKLYDNGVIYHASPLIQSKLKFNNPKSVLLHLNQKRKVYSRKKALWHKSAGYHAFNLYAFSMYKYILPNHPFWDSKKFKRILSVIKKPSFIQEQSNNIYSYPYNPTGSEIAYTLETFLDGESDEITSWINRQFEYFENPQVLSKNIDIKTLNARIYELCRLTRDYQIISSF